MTTKSLKIQQIAAGSEHSLLLLNDGSVWATGDNYNSQLGDGTTADKNSWTQIKEAEYGVTQVAAGSTHSLLLKADGSVWATGNNDYGQLGDGTTVNTNSWTQVMASEATQVAGCNHSLLLKTDGSVWATGRNAFGQLGDGTKKSKKKWTQITEAGTDVIQVAAGFSHSLLLKTDGSVWATGEIGSESNPSQWTTVVHSGVTQLASGELHCLLVDEQGFLCVTGQNTQGQLGLPPDVFKQVDTWFVHPFWQAFILEQLIKTFDGSDPEEDDSSVFCL